MVIESVSLMEEIVSAAPSQPPEIGGILGGTNQVVSLYALDKGIVGGAMCSYTPDVMQLNHQIQRWAEDRIEFMGMFHVHFGGAATLSPGDRRYSTPCPHSNRSDRHKCNPCNFRKSSLPARSPHSRCALLLSPYQSPP